MPFPAPYPRLATPSPALAASLAAAVAEGAVRFPGNPAPGRLALSLVAINDFAGSPTFEHAGLREHETHYSASLLKVAAMYAAFELRRSVANAAASIAASTADELFAHVAGAFDPLIANAVGRIRDDPALPAAQKKAPSYRSMFAAIPLVDGGFTVEFNADFQAQLRAMIVDGSNTAAQVCVQRLGYAWINGTLASGGFLDANAGAGIWLAGTFTGASPVVRVDTVNDGPAAQAMSTDAMANLYASIEAGSLAGGDGAGRMHGLLEEAAGGDEPSWLLRSEIAPPDAGFLVQATKIGLGPLKAANGGFDVCSEGSVLVHRGTDRRFIAVWQNCPHASRAVVPFVIGRAIKLFVAVP